jgi:hypothetical protein
MILFSDQSHVGANSCIRNVVREESFKLKQEKCEYLAPLRPNTIYVHTQNLLIFKVQSDSSSDYTL